MDMDLEVVVLPVANVDRAKNFYKQALGWREDADIARGEDFREVQMTPRLVPPGNHQAPARSVTAGRPAMLPTPVRRWPNQPFCKDSWRVSELRARPRAISYRAALRRDQGTSHAAAGGR